MDTENTQTIEESLGLLPEGAKVFLYKGPYKKALEQLSKEFSLNKEQEVILSGAIIERMIDTSDEFIEIKTLGLLGFEKSKLEELGKRAAELILKPIQDFSDAEIIEGENINTIILDNNSDIATILGNRLTQSTIIAAPTKRDYSMDKAPSAPSSPVRAADSYREAIDL